MAISFIASAIVTGTPTGSFALTIPGSTAVGDLMVVSFFSETAVTTPTVSDTGDVGAWTRVGNAGSQQLFTFWKRATANSAGATLNVGSLSNSVTGVLSILRGTRPSGDPFDVITQESNISGNETHAAITPSVNNCWIGFAHGSDIPTTIPSSVTATNPANLSPLLTSDNVGGSVTTIAGAVQTTAASTGTVSFPTPNAASVSQLYAIRPHAITTLAADIGSYSLTGTLVNLRRTLLAGASSYVYQGIDPILLEPGEMYGLSQGQATVLGVQVQQIPGVGVAAGEGFADAISGSGAGSGSTSFLSKMFLKDVKIPALKFFTSDVDKVYFEDVLIFRKNVDTSGAGLSAGFASVLGIAPIGNQVANSLYDFVQFLAGFPATAGVQAGGTLTINGVALGSFDYVIKDGPVTLSTFNNADWFTSTENSRSAFIVVKGDLTIDASRTLIPDHRKLFTVVYVTGDLVCNGNISMTGKGANHSATGSNIAAGNIRIANGTFSGVVNPQVPAAGGTGGAARVRATMGTTTGATGSAGADGGSGGGGSGGVDKEGTTGTLTSGAGAAGTSFCGGSGGGGVAQSAAGVNPATAQDGAVNGGKGGDADVVGSPSAATGGAGNPGGDSTFSGGGGGISVVDGDAGAGGTLVVIVDGELSGSGVIESEGKNTGTVTGDPSATANGGGSGGGSITVLAKTQAVGVPTRDASGGSGVQSGGVSGGNGGAGSTRLLTIP